MRNGMNPNREEVIHRPLPPATPVSAIITHLPNLEGYHAERLQIVKTCLITAWENSGAEAFWMVWDNGSCPELTGWLQRQKWIDMLVQSVNIGKLNAVGAILRMFPGAIVGISDDDMLFYKGWLRIQIETLKAHNAALVSGCTTKFLMKGQSADGDIIPDHNFPRLWDEQHGQSLGMSQSVINSIYATITARMVVKDDVIAYRGGAHCQFICQADLIAPFCKPTTRYMQPLAPIDREIDGAGLTRLLTQPRTVRHLGNKLSDDDRREIAEMMA